MISYNVCYRETRVFRQIDDDDNNMKTRMGILKSVLPPIHFVYMSYSRLHMNTDKKQNSVGFRILGTGDVEKSKKKKKIIL